MPDFSVSGVSELLKAGSDIVGAPFQDEGTDA